MFKSLRINRPVHSDISQRGRVKIGRRIQAVLFGSGITIISLAGLAAIVLNASPAAATSCFDGNPICAPTSLQNGSIISDSTPGTWEFWVSSNLWYQLIVDNNSDFGSPEYETHGTYSPANPYTITLDTPLADGSYYWKAYSCDWHAEDVAAECGASDIDTWLTNPTGGYNSYQLLANSGGVAFSLDTSGVVITGGADVLSGDATNNIAPGPFEFNDLYGNSMWELQIDDSADFGSPVIYVGSDDYYGGPFSYSTGDTSGLTYTTGDSSTTLPDGSYYWRVRECAHYPEAPGPCWGDPGAWTEALGGSVAFIVDTIGPDQPTITSPVDAETLTTYTPTFTSSDPAGIDNGTHVASQWQVAYAYDTSFSSPIYDPGDDVSNLTSLTYPGTPTALTSDNYLVRVRYKDSLGNYSNWSDGINFFIDGEAPSTPTITYPVDGAHLKPFNLASEPPYQTDTPADNIGVVNGEWQVDTVETFDSVDLVDTVNVSYASGYNDLEPNLSIDDTYYIRVRYQDAAGNWSEWSLTNTVYIDGTPPSLDALDISTNNPFHSTIARKGSTITVNFTTNETLDDGTLIAAPYVKLGDSIPFTQDSHTGNDYSYSLTLDPGTGYVSPSSIAISAYDLAGNQMFDASNTIVIDQTPPAAPGVSDPATTVYTNTPTYTVTGTTEADNRVEIFTDPACNGVAGSSAGDQQLNSGNTAYSIEVTLTSDTTNCFVVSSRDPAGNDSDTMTATGHIVQDSINPTAPSITDPINNSYITTHGPTLVGNTYSDTNSQLAAHWQIDDNINFNSFSGGPLIDDPNDTFNLSSYSGFYLGDFTWYARVRYQDVAGNWSGWSTSISFTVDTTAPETPTLTFPTEGSYISDNTPTLTGSSFVDTNTQAAAEWQTDIGTGFNTGYLVDSGTDTVNLSSYTTSALMDYVWYSRVRYQDIAGNWSEWSIAVSYTVDITQPGQPSITAPTEGSITNDSTPTLAGSSYSDTNAQHAAQWQADTVNTFDSVSLVDSGTDTDNTSTYTTSTLSDGLWHVRVRYQDIANNWSEWSPSVSFTVDATNPETPSITYPSTEIITDNTPTITASSFSDTNTQLAAQWQIDITDAFNTGSLIDSGTDLVNLSSYTSTTLADGVWYAQVRYQDEAENWSSWSIASDFYVDTAGPDKPSITAPTNASTTHLASPTITGSTYSDSGNGIYGVGAQLAAQWQLDSSNTFDSQSGSPLIDSGTDTVNLASYTPTSPLMEGTWYVRIRYQESTGNWSAWSDTIQFDEKHISNIVITTDNPNDDDTTAVRGGTITVTFDLSGTPDSNPTVSLGGSYSLSHVSHSGGTYVYTISLDPNTTYPTPVSVIITAPFNSGAWNATDSSQSVNIQNLNPDKPVISDPTEGATVTIDHPTIVSSDFVGYYSQAAAKWQLDTVSTFDSQSGSPSVDTGDDGVNLTSYTASSLTDGTWYVRVSYRDAAAEYSPWSDTVSFSVNTGAAEDPTLSFSIGSTSCNLGTLSSSAASTCSHTITAASNATDGFIISYEPGNTLTSGMNTINAIGPNEAGSSPGTPQFGLNLVENSSPAVGSNSTGSVSSHYSTTNQFAFDTGGSEIAYSTGPAASTEWTVSYLANIGADTPAGSYSTNMVFSITAAY